MKVIQKFSVLLSSIILLLILLRNRENVTKKMKFLIGKNQKSVCIFYMRKYK